MLLTDFDNNRAVIEPSEVYDASRGETCSVLLASFNGNLIRDLVAHENLVPAGHLTSLNGDHPWYIWEKDGLKLGLFLLPIGAAMAVGQLEELHAVGFERVIVLGSCGVLDKGLDRLAILLPASGLRDEVTSYHYAPASGEIGYDPALLLTTEKALSTAGLSCQRVKTWTTDAFYRETPAKVKKRLAAGAQVVDMEATALMAWIQFRQVPVYQFFYTTDFLDPDQRVWDKFQDRDQTDHLALFEVVLVIARELSA